MTSPVQGPAILVNTILTVAFMGMVWLIHLHLARTIRARASRIGERRRKLLMLRNAAFLSLYVGLILIWFHVILLEVFAVAWATR